jgi:3-hydroxyethyl bacteriochlorophyllide a dehydrogenase
MTIRAVVFVGAGRAELQAIALPPIGPHELLVRSLVTCVSPGTELRTFAGKQQGVDPFPLVPGYQIVGEVIEASAGHEARVGRRVFVNGGSVRFQGVGRAWGAHASHAIVHAASTFDLPARVEPLDVACTKVSAIGHRGVDATQPGRDDVVAVVGLGLIGQLSARLFALKCKRVVAVDVAPWRVEHARRAGIDAWLSTGHAGETVRSVVSSGVDIAVDCTGVPAVLEQTLDALREHAWADPRVHGPKLVVQGSYPDRFEMPYMPAFRKEIAMVFPRDNKPRDIQAAIDLVASGALSTRDLITDVVTPDQCQRVYDTLSDRSSSAMTFAFRWD